MFINDSQELFFIALWKVMDSLLVFGSAYSDREMDGVKVAVEYYTESKCVSH